MIGTRARARLSNTRPHRAWCAGLLLMAAHGPKAAGGEPSPVSIPEALRVHVPMVELSGLVWVPSLDRYLAVVDDTVELEDGNRRAPFVLALDRAGHADAQIVPIDGVEALDDAEALTAAPDGTTLFLMTSHSLTKKGKVRKPRRQLLQLHVEGRRLRATGKLDLLQGDFDVAHRLETLGLPAETPVDLEGLTFHDGALYIGVKSPLLSDGSAVILRLDDPAQALAQGKLGPKSLSVWGRAKLSVPTDGTGPLVSQGIAELLFAPDGALYLCANAPKNGAKDGGGALWRVANPHGGQLEAKLVRRFIGLKPEGLAVAPGGGALTLVFDRNTSDPFWMTWPIAPRAVAGTARRAQP